MVRATIKSKGKTDEEAVKPRMMSIFAGIFITSMIKAIECNCLWYIPQKIDGFNRFEFPESDDDGMQ